MRISNCYLSSVERKIAVTHSIFYQDQSEERHDYQYQYEQGGFVQLPQVSQLPKVKVSKSSSKKNQATGSVKIALL
jgi:hypothetical protein